MKDKYNVDMERMTDSVYFVTFEYQVRREWQRTQRYIDKYRAVRSIRDTLRTFQQEPARNPMLWITRQKAYLIDEPLS